MVRRMSVTTGRWVFAELFSTQEAHLKARICAYVKLPCHAALCDVCGMAGQGLSHGCVKSRDSAAVLSWRLYALQSLNGVGQMC